ncbi:MrcB family domain-containing protein [Pseudomonas sp. H9]|uniref:MrcB family domain-containing protein n=1 Tax=Pseudomonas sp. H9 TaxID=483968 RepID=UPI001057EB7F|nr:DUF3578 domain-containing protein [Pseudomonas sp. H9]TDF85788.1 DUF3578 domain-containing protein [Pseudomonas sp. H9]
MTSSEIGHNLDRHEISYALTSISPTGILQLYEMDAQKNLRAERANCENENQPNRLARSTAVNQSPAQLFASLKRANVLGALKQLAQSTSSRFASATKFELVYQSQRYAPKEVAALALEHLFHKAFDPKDLKGEEGSVCFNALSRLGFTIIPKQTVAPPLLLCNIIKRILELQTQHSSQNTPLMQERGELVRKHFKERIYDAFNQIEPIFSQHGFDCAVEGSDGIGRKSYSPWVRIFTPSLSPSATEGWYVVIHFSSLGDCFYVTLGCGSTEGVDLKHLPSEELDRRKAWARDRLNVKGLSTSKFQDPIALHGNKLSKQFERATLCAKKYLPESFDENEFWQDITELCTLLTCIYDSVLQGKSPDDSQSALAQASAEIENVVSPTQKAQGQGRLRDPDERRVVELQAMALAKAELEAIGFSAIRDTSANHSYDFEAYKSGSKWLIEVKGTTSSNAEAFLLTANELELHRSNTGKTGLAIVYDIELDRSGTFPIASKGLVKLFLPWDPEEWEFSPSAYIARKKMA